MNRYLYRNHKEELKRFPNCHLGNLCDFTKGFLVWLYWQGFVGFAAGFFKL